MGVRVSMVEYDSYNRVLVVALGNALVRYSWLGYTQLEQETPLVMDKLEMSSE